MSASDTTRAAAYYIQESPMGPTSSTIGLIVIVVLYISIGGMSAAGSAYIARSLFSAKAEQIFFALFLIPIAGFYLAFTVYFGDSNAWQMEASDDARLYRRFGVFHHGRSLCDRWISRWCRRYTER